MVGRERKADPGHSWIPASTQRATTLSRGSGATPVAREVVHRLVVDQMPGGFLHVAADGAVLASNPSAERILGTAFDASTTISDVVRDLVTEDGRALPPAAHPVARAIATREAQPPVTLGFRRRDGEPRWAIVSATPVGGCGSFAETEACGAIVTFVDITPRKLAEAALRDSEELLRSVVESTPITIATADREGKILFVSNAPASVAPGTLAWERLLPEEHAVARAAFERAMTTCSPSMFEARGESGRRWRVQVGPRYEDSAVAGVTFVAWDITEQHALESRVAIADRMASIGTLAASVAHEINNPLTYVLANVEAVARDAAARGDGSTIERLNAALEGISRIRCVVSDLGTFAHADADRRQLIDVHAVLETALRMAQTETRYRARIVRELGPVPLVLASEARLGQVFLNLIVNAAQALPEGAAQEHEIALVTSTDDAGRAVIEVRDTGVGIPPLLMQRIFDPFVTTKPRGEGTGLGLYICRNVVSSLGGELAISSREGCGTTVRVTLPRAETTLGMLPRSPAAASGIRLRPLRVLVADDEPLVAEMLRSSLEGHDVDVVHSGRDAIEHLLANDYDVAFCDLIMPDQTGMDVFERVRAARPGREQSIVFITGGPFTPRAAEFLGSVDAMVLQKPFTPAEVRSVLPS